MADMLTLFEAARRVSVPIVVVRTADQPETEKALTNASVKHPVVRWEAANGMTGVNELGKKQLANKAIKGQGTLGFTDAMILAAQLDQATVLIVHNAHRQLTSAEPLSTASSVQALVNLREQFKGNYRMVVLLCPVFTAPPELEQDVVVLDQELPTREALQGVVKELWKGAKVPGEPSPELLGRAGEALIGLTTFAAEQVSAMSFTTTGVNLEALWERKRVAINQTRGLRVWTGKERFSDLVGLECIKEKLRRRIASTTRTPVGVVVWMDEIDKVFANVEHDTSGVRMDQMRTFLTEMENHEWLGLVAVGVGGGGKSALAKAFGNEAGVPTVALDLGDVQGPHVGESEAMLRHCMDVIKAIGGGHAYVIATSNNATVMRPEMQRRFTDGFWFFDIMTAEERAAAWQHYIRKYQLSPKQATPLPPDDAWTGAEIRNCCREAWDTGITLVQAAQYIVPMATSRAKDIDQLRVGAHGKYLDASRPGTYEYRPAPMQSSLRAITLPPDAVEVLAEVPKKRMN